MSSVDAINYLALEISGSAQFASNTKASSAADYTDGLSSSELEKIDSDGDGAITWAEFKTAFNGDEAETYWNQYKNYYNSVTNTSEKQISSVYDSSGKLSSYTVTLSSTNETSTGNKTVFSYDNSGKVTSLELNGTSYTDVSEDGDTITVKDNNGAIVAKVTQNSNGMTIVEYDHANSSVTTSSYTDGQLTSKSVEQTTDGKSSTLNYTYSYDDSGRIEQVLMTGNGKYTTTKYTYDENGNVSTNTTVSDTTQKTTTRSDGTYTVTTYDSSGNITAKENYNKDGSLRSASYDIESLLSSLYPDLGSTYITNIAKCIIADSSNDISSSSQLLYYNVNMDNESLMSAINKYISMDETTLAETAANLSTSETSSSSANSTPELAENQEISTRNDGSYTITTYDNSGNITAKENYYKEGGLRSAYYTIESLLSALYPELSSSEIKNVADSLISDSSNDISSSSQLLYYNYNLNNTDLNNAISKYIDKSGNVIS